jgi:hypothetical protein
VATKQVNTFNISVGSGSQSTLPQPVAFDVGKKCQRIRVRIQAVMGNTGSAYNMTAANCVTLLAALVSNFYLAWGNSEEMTVDPTLPFNMMRLMYAQLEGRDFYVNNIQLNAVSGSTVQIAASGTATTLTFEFIRSFIIRKTLNELHTFCPGTSQMQQIKLGITPSASAAPTFNSAAVTLTNATAVPCAILFEEMDADSDQWAQVPIIREASPTAGGQNIPLPVGNGGTLLAVGDLSSNAASYGLTLFDLDTGNPAQGAQSTGASSTFINGLCTFQQEYSAYIQDSASTTAEFDWSTLAAPLYQIPTANDVAHLDSVASLNFYQPNNDITAPQLCVCYVPTNTPGTVNSAGKNIMGAKGGAFKLANAVGAGGSIGTSTQGAVPSGVAAVLPLQIHTPTSPAYNTAPGISFTPNASPVPVIPAPVLSSAKTSANNQPGGISGSAGTSQLAKSTSAIVSALPGYAMPGKSVAPTAAHLSVASAITSHGTSTIAGKSNAAAATSATVNKLSLAR